MTNYASLFGCHFQKRSPLSLCEYLKLSELQILLAFGLQADVIDSRGETLCGAYGMMGLTPDESEGAGTSFASSLMLVQLKYKSNHLILGQNGLLLQVDLGRWYTE